MTQDEAVAILVRDGTKAVGQSIHPAEWPILEWATIVAHAVQQRPELYQEIKADLFTRFIRAAKAETN